MSGAGAGSGAEIFDKLEPVKEPQQKLTGSATLLFVRLTRLLRHYSFLQQSFLLVYGTGTKYGTGTDTHKM
jgi:hypothetical protein